MRRTGNFVDVVDGNTIKVLFDQDGKIYTVRYVCINAPDYPGEYFGEAAAVRNVELVLGKSITLIKDVSETDVDGELLQYAIVNAMFVNHELVEQGNAKTAHWPPAACIPTFQEAEQNASASKLWLWMHVQPTIVGAPPTSSGGGGGVVGIAIHPIQQFVYHHNPT